MKAEFIAVVNKLEEGRSLDKKEYRLLIESACDETFDFIREKAIKVRGKIYGRGVYIRGLIEISNICKNNCYYCGIRRDNRHVQRYRLTTEQILNCCRQGYQLGFRTFVLQGGEDPYFTDQRMEEIIRQIKGEFPDCALTLSIGEKSRDSYQRLFDAGANRYLLRHETANDAHYAQLHPPELSLANRKRCLWDLKAIGYQVGCGFMVGSPGQTPETLAEDLLFIHELAPQMIGIGPFLHHQQTPFAQQPDGSMELTLFLIGLLRLMIPNALIPSTTALATIHPRGRELGILAGANVVMPNLSPTDVRAQYTLYDNKACTGEEAAESWAQLQKQMHSIGYCLAVDRGDFKPEVHGTQQK